MTNIKQIAECLVEDPNARVAFQYQDIGRVRIVEAIPDNKLIFDVYGAGGECRRIFLSAFDDDGVQLLPAVTKVIDLYRCAEELERDLRIWGQMPDVLKRPTSQIEDIILEAFKLAHKNVREEKVRELNSARTKLTLAIEAFTGQCTKESA